MSPPPGAFPFALAGAVTFTYDTMLRRSVEQVGTSIAKYSYDRDGLAIGMGAVSLGRVSATGRLSGIDVGDAGQRYTDTPFGEVAGYRSQGAGGNVLDVTMTYDALSRIVDKIENGVTWNYDYDYDVRGLRSCVLRRRSGTRASPGRGRG